MILSELRSPDNFLESQNTGEVAHEKTGGYTSKKVKPLYFVLNPLFYFLWLEILYDVFSVCVKSLDMKYIFCALIFKILFRAKHRFKRSINGTLIFKM